MRILVEIDLDGSDGMMSVEESWQEAMYSPEVEQAIAVAVSRATGYAPTLCTVQLVEQVDFDAE